MKRSNRKRTLALGLASLLGVAAMPGQALAAPPTGLSDAALAGALATMPAPEREGRAATFTNPRYQVLDYERLVVPTDAKGNLQFDKVTSAPAKASGSYVIDGLYISISVARDTDIKTSYYYDIQSYFDWQGATEPWNGTAGYDGFALAWGNSLALRSDNMWGKYRSGANLAPARTEVTPNCCVGYEFYELRSGSVADYGWLTATVTKSSYTGTDTNFTIKYIHTWGSYDYSFTVGSGPSVTMSPTTKTRPISTYATIRT